MIQNRKHIEWFNKLLKGTISKQEQWQLEKASLDDPFLADALESFYDGLYQMSDVPTLTNQEKEERKVISIWKWVSIAASFLVIGGLSMWLLNSHVGESQLSAVSSKSLSERVVPETENMASSTPDAESAIQDRAFDQVNKEEEQSKAPTMTSKKSAGNEPKELFDKTKEFNQEALAFEDQEIASTPSPTIIEESMDAEIAEDLPAKTPPVSKSSEGDLSSRKKMAAKSYQDAVAFDLSSGSSVDQVINGKVLTIDGLPLANAQVVSLYNKDSVLTDDQGVFAINVNSTNDELKAFYTGYIQEKLVAQPDVNFRLKPIQETLSEEVKPYVELMDENDLKELYKKKINQELIKEMRICDGNDSAFFKFKAYITVNEQGLVESLDYVSNLSVQCQNEIMMQLERLALLGIFDGKRRVQFLYSHNF